MKQGLLCVIYHLTLDAEEANSFMVKWMSGINLWHFGFFVLFVGQAFRDLAGQYRQGWELGSEELARQVLKWYYDENRIFPIILKHKQEVFMRS